MRPIAPSHALRGLCLLLSTVALTAFGALAPGAANASTNPVSTTTTLRPNAVRVASGYAETLTVTLRRAADGARINGVIKFYRQSPSASTWTYGGSLATSNGVARLTYKAVRTTRWHAVYYGGSAYARSSSATSTVTVVSSSAGTRYVQEAARHAGAPYQWGAAGPTRFDCSGFTRYVYGRFGKSLPHNSGQQYAASRHISRSAMQVGDLLFFHNSGGSIDHVAIYAGNGYMWASTHTGSYVKKQRIYSSSYYVGRV